MKQKLLAIFIVLAVISIAIIVVNPELRTAEYGVPFAVVTTTIGESWHTLWNVNDRVMSPNNPNPTPTNDDWPTYLWGSELISASNDQVVVTAWNPQNQGQTSEFISCHGLTVWPECAAYGSYPANSPNRYYYRVYLKDATHPTWTPVVYRNGNEQITVDTSVISVGTASPFQPPCEHFPMHPNAVSDSSSLNYYNEQGQTYTIPSTWWRYQSVHSWPECKYHVSNAPSFDFSVKGARIGALRVEFVEQLRDVSLDYEGYYPVKFQTDEIYLASGWGDFNIENQQGASQTTFEEGDTVVFACDVDYSGATQGTGEGWVLRLWNLDTSQEYFGSCTNGGTPDTFPADIPDDKRNWQVKWVVPPGTFNPEGNNMWKAELWNTLFNQHEEYLFTIDDYDKAPGDCTIEFTDGKDHYGAGETVHVRIKALANSLGSGYIEKFWWCAYYSPNKPPYIPGAEPVYSTQVTNVGGGWYQTDVSFVNTGGDEVIVVEALANDGQGRHSIHTSVATILSVEEGAGNIVTVKVEEETTGKDLYQAKVTLDDGDYLFTEPDGKAYFRDVPSGTHKITASKEGYRTATKTVVVNDPDTRVNFALQKGSDVMMLVISIIIPIIILFIFVALAIFIVPPFRYIILIVGIAIAALLFYIFYFTDLLAGLLAGL